MNIDSKLWSVVSCGDGYAEITQRSTGQVRTVNIGELPSVHQLAMMHEKRFDAVMRDAFNGN